MALYINVQSCVYIYLYYCGGMTWRLVMEERDGHWAGRGEGLKGASSFFNIFLNIWIKSIVKGVSCVPISF